MKWKSPSSFTTVVIVVSLLTLSCYIQSTWLRGNDIQGGHAPFKSTDEVQHKRKLLQSGNVQVSLKMGLLESNCNNYTEVRASSRFLDEWNQIMNCTQCTLQYDFLPSCDPLWLWYTIVDQTTTKDQLQRLINTLVVVPDCVLSRFSYSGQIDVNFTRRGTSHELDIPSVEIIQNFNASRYPLLEYCNYEVEDGDQARNDSDG